MNYLTIEGRSVSTHDIAQAHLQLEADYNVGGWLQERPSNQRRKASTGWQLARMHYNPAARWVDIKSQDPADSSEAEDNDNVRIVYLGNVLRWDLPVHADQIMSIRRLFTETDLVPYAERLQIAQVQGHWCTTTIHPRPAEETTR